MGAFEFPRDEKGKPPKMTFKTETDRVFAALEAFANLQIFPAGSGRLEFDGKRAILYITPSGGGAGAFPFQVLKGTPPPGNTAANWVKVSLNSFLLHDADPTSKIAINGLNASFQINGGERIWLEIDLRPTYTSGQPIATIRHGINWNGGLSFFPLPVAYDTDNGTRTGSSGTPPDNSKQTFIYVPIAYVESSDTDHFGLIAGGFASFSLGGKLYLIQQLRDNLMMGGACVDGGQVNFVTPWPIAPQPPTT